VIQSRDSGTSQALIIPNHDILFQNDHLLTGGTFAIGSEVAVPSHLLDGQEYTVLARDLIRFGEHLFTAMWTIQAQRAPVTRCKRGSRPLEGSIRLRFCHQVFGVRFTRSKRHHQMRVAINQPPDRSPLCPQG
jgi:hypothetical protein